MAGLAETTARLKRLRRMKPAADDRRQRKMTETSGFGSNPGALRMLSYRPKGSVAGLPLVVVLHGCGQKAEAFAREAGWLTLADRCGFMVIAAEQSSANNPNRCFNWFEPRDSCRGEGEAASIASMVAQAVRTQEVDPRQVFITGFSAGGAMTTVMLATYPDVFAAGAVVAGLPFGVAQGMASAMGAMHGGGNHGPDDLGELVRAAAPSSELLPRIVIWHGEADYLVHPHNASDIASQWINAHGLSRDEGTSVVFSKWARTVWHKPGFDRVMIELNLVPGLGHGTPLSTSGEDGLGEAAPYMLEAGISSSLEIARFWGLADQVERTAVALREPKAGADLERRSALFVVGDQVMASLSSRVPGPVQDVIEKALQRAGLRR